MPNEYRDVAVHRGFGIARRRVHSLLYCSHVDRLSLCTSKLWTVSLASAMTSPWGRHFVRHLPLDLATIVLKHGHSNAQCCALFQNTRLTPDKSKRWSNRRAGMTRKVIESELVAKRMTMTRSATVRPCVSTVGLFCTDVFNDNRLPYCAT